MTAFVYLFGRAIGDAQPQNSDKYISYFQGGFFIFIYMLLPYLAIHSFAVSFGFYENNLKSDAVIIFLLIVLTISISIIFAYVGLKVEHGKINTHVTFFKRDCNPETILVFPIITAGMSYFFGYLIYCLFVNSQNLEVSSIVLSVGVFSTTFLAYFFLAVIFGNSSVEYPHSRIKLRNGRFFEGQIVKFGEYITLVTEDKIYDINKSDICYIEKSRDNLSEASLEESNDQKDQGKLITE